MSSHTLLNNNYGIIIDDTYYTPSCRNMLKESSADLLDLTSDIASFLQGPPVHDLSLGPLRNYVECFLVDVGGLFVDDGV